MDAITSPPLSAGLFTSKFWKPPDDFVAPPIRIAIASSGLGHVNRGIESWAWDTAHALNNCGEDVTLFQGAGKTSMPWQEVVSCHRRGDAHVRKLVKATRRCGGWRYGCGSEYEVEQTTFALNLWRRIALTYDILHVQDPLVAAILDRLNRLNLSRPRVILAHGTEEPAKALSRYAYLQHLAPCYIEPGQKKSSAKQKVFAIPNSVDVDRFHPGPAYYARRVWELPVDAFIILCVAAVKKSHKRIDSVMHEFDLFRRIVKRPAVLVIAGARDDVETDQLMIFGKKLLGDNVFLTGVERGQMPSLYQAADLFTLGSLHEMMPIAVLEALATGLPIACNDTPTLRWMVGDAGTPIDIRRPGALATQWLKLMEVDEWSRCRLSARVRAVKLFSERTVVTQTILMYRAVMSGF